MIELFGYMLFSIGGKMQSFLSLIVFFVCIILILASVAILVDDPFGATTRVEIQADAMVRIARINAWANVIGRTVDQLPSLLILAGLGFILSRYIGWEMGNERKKIELQARWRALPELESEQNAIIATRYEVKKSC